jgi:predicted nucleic acid-binding protein
MDELVLDSSVALAWAFGDESTPYADALLDRAPLLEILVPAIWPLEVANALLVAERRRRSTEADTQYSIRRLLALSITLDVTSLARAGQETLAIARTHNLSSYDASYLELAMRRGLPLATLDERLRAVAGALGVPLYTPPDAGA